MQFLTIWKWEVKRFFKIYIKAKNVIFNKRKTISIIIVNENIEQFREIKKACTKWRITEENYKNMILTDYFQVVIIELSKATEEYKNNNE